MKSWMTPPPPPPATQSPKHFATECYLCLLWNVTTLWEYASVEELINPAEQLMSRGKDVEHMLKVLVLSGSSTFSDEIFLIYEMNQILFLHCLASHTNWVISSSKNTDFSLNTNTSWQHQYRSQSGDYLSKPGRENLVSELCEQGGGPRLSFPIPFFPPHP